MLLSQGRTKCREVTGPMPHTVAVRAKWPSSRPADQVILDIQRKDATREKVLEFTKHMQTCDITTSWLNRSEGRFLRGTVERGVKAAMNQQEAQIHQRRDRLRALLQSEEHQLLGEMEQQTETAVERQAKMKERAKGLREKRERDRQLVVASKLDQLFSEQCEELRAVQRERRQQQVCSERGAQVKSRQNRLLREQHEEKVFSEFWTADKRAKDEREAERAHRQQLKNMEQLQYIRKQMDQSEHSRQRERQLREEEATLMLQQQQLNRLLSEREQQMKLNAQQTRRRALDQGYRMKMRRLAKEQQDELETDMTILRQLLQQESDEKQGRAQRKAELKVEGQKYRQYLSDELENKRREEEEIEQLMEVKLKEVWLQRDEQSRRQRDARNRLMAEVMETRSLQIQHKLGLNLQKQLELSQEREETKNLMQQMKLENENEKRRHQSSCEAYRTDLVAQIRSERQRVCEERAQTERETQQGVMMHQLYEQRKEDILARPAANTVTTANTHPFRREQGAQSPP